VPVDNNIMGVGTLPVGGDSDFYMLSKAPDYPLPFSVWGHFDLSAKPIPQNMDIDPRTRRQSSVPR
jgi:hypothetical protein